MHAIAPGIAAENMRRSWLIWYVTTDLQTYLLQLQLTQLNALYLLYLMQDKLYSTKLNNHKAEQDDLSLNIARIEKEVHDCKSNFRILCDSRILIKVRPQFQK